jgi:phage-related protein
MYIMIDGENTLDYGARVMALPPIQIARKRVSLITIPGRSGYLTQWDGSYDEVIKLASFFYDGASPERIARMLLEGSTVTFSNEPDKVYDYRLDITADLTNTISTWHQWDLQFICNPVKRATSPESIYATVSPVMLVSTCNHAAYPTITLTGTGDVTLTVGDQEIALTDISPAITIDGDLMECYQSDTLASDKMTGDFPEIAPGDAVSISWTGSVTKIEILPNWRWV